MKEIVQLKAVPKTKEEKILSAKYLKLMQTDNFEELQQIADDFKADLVSFLSKRRKYRAVFFLLFCQLSFAQSEIVAASYNDGNSSFTIGSSVHEINVELSKKQLHPKPIPKPRGRPKKYNKSKKQKKLKKN